MKRTVGYILGFILMGVFLFILIFSGIKDLTAKQVSADTASEGQLVEYDDIVYASEVYVVHNKLEGLIPLYDDHYYVVADTQGIKSYVVKADEKWYSENFGADGAASGSVSIDGLLKKPDELNLNKVNSMLADIGQINPLLYVDSCYAAAAWASIGAGGLYAAAAITIGLAVILVAKGIVERNGAAVKVMTAVSLIQLVVGIVCMVIIS